MRYQARPGAWLLLAISVLIGALVSPPVMAAPPDRIAVTSAHNFDDTVARVEQAVQHQSMVLIATASASRGAAGRGIKIPGNAVVLLFRNDFARRLLEANLDAGIEAPMRIYITELGDGGTRISYVAPSLVLAPYGDGQLTELGRELDGIFATIVQEAAGS